MGSNCFSEVKFLACFKIASMFFSSLCFFQQSLGQLQDYPVIIIVSAGDSEWRGTYVTCPRVTLLPSLLRGGASGMLSIRGLRFLERKIWGFFLRTKLRSLNKWSNVQEGKCLTNHFILLQIIFFLRNTKLILAMHWDVFQESNVTAKNGLSFSPIQGDELDPFFPLMFHILLPLKDNDKPLLTIMDNCLAFYQG